MERAVQLTYYTLVWLGIGLYFFTSSQTIGYSIFTFLFGGLALCENANDLIFYDLYFNFFYIF
jgi:hypothetical protein